MNATQTKYEPRITKTADGEFYALIVRIDRDGEVYVLRGYKGRHFKTHTAAAKSIDKYLARIANS